jgi:hypothetical protein
MAKDPFSYEDATGPTNGFSYEDAVGQPAEKPKRGLVDWGKDIAATALKGAIAVPEAAVGLLDLATQGRAGKMAEDVGIRFKDARAIADDFNSDATKAARQEFQQAQGLGGKAAAALANPSVIATTVGESLPSMFAGGALAKGVGLAAPALAGRAGLAAAGEGAMMAGSQAESIRQQTEDGLLTGKQAALAAGTGLAGGAIGALGARAGKALGVGDVDTMIAGGSQGVAREGMGLANRIGRGALAEGVLEELPQSLAETALGNIALDRNVTEGMDEAAVLGTLSGGLMGGAAGALSRPAPLAAAAGGPNLDQPVKDQQVQPEQPAPQAMGESLTGGIPGLMGNNTDPLRSVIQPSLLKPSQAMGIDPSAGPLSRAAASAVDSAPQPISPIAPVAAPVPMEQRSLDELRTALRSAQDPAIRKTIAAEIRKRRESMPDPLTQQPLIPEPQTTNVTEPAPSIEAAKAVESRQEEPQAPAQPAALGSPLTDSGASILGRGADPLQSIIEGRNNAERESVTPPEPAPVPAPADAASSKPVQEAAQPDAGALTEPDAKALTPKQYHEAKLKYIAQRNGIDISEVRRFYGNEAAQKADEQEWVSAVREGFKAGEQLNRKTLDQLETLRPGAVASFLHDFPSAKIPDGYFLPGVRKADAEEKKARSTAAREIKKQVEQETAAKVASGEMDRPPRWRTNAIQASKVAKQIGLDPKGKRLAQIVAEIDAKDGNVQDAPSQPTRTETQAAPVEARAAEGGNAAEAGGVPAAGDGAGVQQGGVKTEKDIEGVILKSIADGAIKRNQKLYAEKVAKRQLTQEEANRRAASDEKMWSEQKSNDRTQRLAKAIAEKDPTVLVGAWAKEGQGTFGNEGSMEAFKTLTGINLKRMNSADRAKAIFDWAGWFEDQVRADVQKRKAEKAEAEAKRDKEQADDLAQRIEKEAAKTPLRIKGQEGESTVKAYIDGLIQQGYTELGQTQIGAIKRALLAKPGEGRGYPMQKGVLADYAKVASERFNAAKKPDATPAAPGAGGVQADGVAVSQPKPEKLPQASNGAGSVSQQEESIVVKEGKGLIKGKFLVDVDGDGAPGGPWNTPEQARLAGEEWKKKTIQNAKDSAQERARWNAIAEKLKAGQEVTTAQIESLGLKAGTSDVRWFFPIAARLFDITSRDIRPIVKSLIRDSFTDMGAKREFVPTRKALEAVAADVSGQTTTAQPEAEPLAVEKPQAQERFEAGKSLTKEQRKAVLATLTDVYKVKGADREMKGVDRNGNERSGYVHSPDLFEKSDITGAMVRYYVTMPDGRKAHPTELFPDYEQSDIDAEMQRREQEERASNEAKASRLKVLQSRIADSLTKANLAFNKQNKGPRAYVPATLTNGTQFVRTAPETAERDAELLGGGWEVQPQAQEQAEPVAPVEKKAASKIEDFGEKLPPARRAAAARLSEKLSDEVLAAQPLSKIWPLEENEAIEDTFAAAVATAMREAIPTKPRVAYKIKSWVEKAKILRDMTAQVLRGDITKEMLMGEMAIRDYSLGRIRSKIKLLEQIDRAQWKRIGFVSESPDAIRYVDGNKVPTPVSSIEIDGKSHWLNGSGDINDHINGINLLLSGEAAQAKMQFEIRQERSGERKVFINKKGDKDYRRLMEFATVEEARAAIKDKYDDLVAAWGGVKDRDNITERDLRTDVNRDRTGKDHRKGRDISAEEFQSAFGFKGGEFGKWVSQGKGAQERQFMLNSAYDALMDLSDILGIPPRAVSLEGSLGIAFGSRGGGWASAHFEPSNLVINLTKPRGAGALAHEWFHALDNYFARKRGGEVKFNGNNGEYRRENYITYKTVPMMVRKDGRGSPVTRERLEEWRKTNKNSGYLDPQYWIEDPKHKQGVRAEVEERFADLVKTLDDSPMLKRARALEGSKGEGDGYWSRIIERAARSFENYVMDRMTEQGYVNDFLANVKPVRDVSKSQDRYPYLLPSEVAPVADAFKNLFDTIKTRETDDGNTEMYFGTKDRGQGTPTDRAVMDMAGEGRNANDILKLIAGTSKSPFRRQIAKRLIATGANPAVSLGGDMGGGEGFKFLAKYSRKNHEVTLSEAAADRAEQIFLHETTHAATLMALDRGGQYADQMKALYEQVKKQGNVSGYGMKNVGEFVAEAFTNPDFQKALKGTPVLGRSAWQRFVTMVRRILGMDVGAQNALEQALELGVGVMRENVALRKARSFRAEDGPAYLGAWHGSPHRFDKFTTDKMGTGEGAQAFGWGLYFASKKEIANWYKEKLSGSAKHKFTLNKVEVNIKGGQKEAGKFADAANALGFSDEAAALAWKTLQDKDGDLSSASSDLGWREKPSKWDEEAANILRQTEFVSEGGRLYKVEIPEETEMLLWDRPLSEQPQKVRDVLSGMDPDNYSESGDDYDAAERGQMVYQRLQSRLGSDKAASEALLAAGIRGIKFMDGTSRNKALRDVKREFLAELPEDADFDEVMELVGTGAFSTKNDDVIKALAADDWLGFDYPSQALSAALSGRLENYDASPALVQAVAATQDDSTYNYVVFSGDDVSITDTEYFGIADAVEQIKAFDVKTAPKNTWAHYRGMAMQALGRRQIVDLYGEEFGPHLKQYDYLVQKMDAEKNENGAAADQLAQDWSNLKDERALAELMHDATLAQIDPAKPQEEGALTLQYKALERRFKDLSPEAQKAFRDARDMYKDHYRAVQQAIKERIERSEMSEGQKRRMMADLDDKLFKELKGVYFPLARFGQYVIVVKDANGEVKNVTRAETVKEAEAVRKELQKAFPAHMGNTVGKVLKQAEFNAGRDAVGKGFMADLMGALDEKGVDDELRDTVAQLYLSSLPDLSWAKHGIHRKGTPGFSQDARRAFAQNMFHGARYLAKLRYSDQLQDELTSMQDYVKAYEGVDEYDSIQGQQVVDEMVKRHDILMNPKSSPVSTALTSFGFLFHMGLSPASAMVNLTQTALVAYPQMGAKWGFDKAGAALLKASNETVRAKNDLASTLAGAELEAFNRAVKDGTIDVTMAHDLAGIAQGEDQGVMWKIRPVMRWASFMFHHAEKFNRQATFLAAYRLAKQANPAMNEDQLYEEAKKATYDGHFDYSAANRARIMQGNWQRVILLFKQYAQSMVYTLSRSAYQSVKSLDPKERTQARKTLGGILAAHAAAAGVLGLPIVGPLLTVASFIGGDDDEPWDAEVAMQNAMADMIGPKAAEVVARGFSRLTPFDISGRVALNKLILPDVQEGLEGKQWAESAMTAALGPVAGIGVNIARGLQNITEGQYMRGMEDMMPTALRGPLKAIRYNMEGAQDKTGITITDDVSLAGEAGQFLGLSPSQVRRDTERRSAIYGYDRALLERRSVLMRMFAEARISGDNEAAQDIQKEIQGYNQKNPARRITPQNLAQSIRNRRKRVQEAEQGVYLPSKRRDALEAVTF